MCFLHTDKLTCIVIKTTFEKIKAPSISRVPGYITKYESVLSPSTLCAYSSPLQEYLYCACLLNHFKDF